MLNAITLSVVMLNVIMVSVMAPFLPTRLPAKLPACALREIKIKRLWYEVKYGKSAYTHTVMQTHSLIQKNIAQLRTRTIQYRYWKYIMRKI